MQTREFKREQNTLLERRYGFEAYDNKAEREGWLINMTATEIYNDEGRPVSAVDLYFMEEDGTKFKVSLRHSPYIYVDSQEGSNLLLSKKYSTRILRSEDVYMDDNSSILGNKTKYTKLYFHTVDELVSVRNDLRNDKVSLREHDVPYLMRASIDLNLYAGLWYSVTERGVRVVESRTDRADITIMAFDIETTKLPLKFPDSSFDQITMISYFVDGNGFLITNRAVVSEDVRDFEYRPIPGVGGSFTVMNQPDEKSLLNIFFDQIIQLQPDVLVTYNGDFFDWPFIEGRAAFHNIDMFERVGVRKDSQGDYLCRCVCHMDCFRWVKRDSYLPIGSQGLKAVTRAKLKYEPIEVDPEEMTSMAADDPQSFASYSVSDAVATYYLYTKYVHTYIFSLCTIIPFSPDEVLRKGSGTLCESLLMARATMAGIIYPNRHSESGEDVFTEDGRVIESQTYVGGHVEGLESGIFRADLPYRFRITESTVDWLKESLDSVLRFSVTEEHGLALSEITNYEQAQRDLQERLSSLSRCATFSCLPLIYHVDVGAMYPNIILTNRLQPYAMPDEAKCASCPFNRPESNCQRMMTWRWRGQIMPANSGELKFITRQLETESFWSESAAKVVPFPQLPPSEQQALRTKRLKDYCQKAYRRVHVPSVKEKTATVCQRENSFYINTVRQFRDRRYKYKHLLKVWKGNLGEATKKGDAAGVKKCNEMIIIYDSLQLAHKCILNSFYGYVMRKGARWFSMEMAGVVCNTGAQIIKRSREIIERIGRPLELDTDGIWCIIPSNFPDSVRLETSTGSLNISFLNSLLNHMVKENFTNHQYQELVDSGKHLYETRSENSIFFEIDGPYLAMILPAAKDEGKELKKRYAVFNSGRQLVELKGFEIKRRGELQLVKNFQSTVFEAFLDGDTLESAYQSAAAVANHWLDVLHSNGTDLSDHDLFELLTESRNMSRALESYGKQKSTSITTARRLAEVLGDDMVSQAGLNCKYIISRYPHGAPVTERAIPQVVYQLEDRVRDFYLKKWMKTPGLGQFDIRNVIDWNYYTERLSGSIQKIITIPAFLQGVHNPVPRVSHPVWLQKKLLQKEDVVRQPKISQLFSKRSKPTTIVYDSTERHPVDELAHWRGVLGSPPPMSTNVGDWLSFHKRKWGHQEKVRRLKAKRQRLDPSFVAQVTPSAKSLTDVLNHPWNILKVSGRDGVFRVWAAINGHLHSLEVVVDRKFYINRRTEGGEEGSAVCSRVKKFLPRGRTAKFLYEYNVPESLFREQFSPMLGDLSRDEVEGVYETRVPLEFRLMMEVGCVCMVNKSQVMGQGQQSMTSFNSRVLRMGTVSSYGYLSGGNRPTFHYLYHHFTKTKTLVGFFNVREYKAEIYIVDKAKSTQIPNATNIYNSEREIGADGRTFPDLVFTVKTETSLERVSRTLGKLVGALKSLDCLVVQSVSDKSWLSSAFPFLDSLPTVYMSCPDRASLYSVLDWQRVGIRVMIRHFLELEETVGGVIDHCRYLHIPIGNYPADPYLFGCDLFFARHLRMNNYVLWCSETDIPDFGGSQVLDLRLTGSDLEQFEPFEVNNPGLYTGVVAELELASVVVSALMQSHRINSLEGVDLNSFHGCGSNSLNEVLEGYDEAGIYSMNDDVALSGPAFRVLKTMALTWINDVFETHNHFADYQLIHMARWIKSSRSLLYQPAFPKILSNLARKLVSQLVIRLQGLGLGVIYADFGRIILSTGRFDVTEATNYLEYAVKSIMEANIFHSLDIICSRIWSALLWYDTANHGGVVARLHELVNQTQTSLYSSVVSEQSQSNVPVMMNWNIAEFLPARSQRMFNNLMVEYFSKLDELIGHNLTVLCDQVGGVPLYLGENVRELIRGTFTEKLFKFVNYVHLTHDKQPFPDLVGSDVREENEALALSRSICEVLRVDEAVVDVVDGLRMSLLTLIGVSEFSKRARFVNPCRSFVLPDVTCGVCHMVRDLDLCRDKGVVEGAWVCTSMDCGHPYSCEEIERRLLSLLRGRVLAFQLQDVRCESCKMIKGDNLSVSCECSGRLGLSLGREELIGFASTLSSVARHFKMPLLGQSVQWVLDNS